MSFITAALIGAGGAFAGGLIASSGARSAAGTQAASADRAAQLQKEMFDRQMEGQEPFRQAGLTGQNRLMELLGLGGNAGAAGYGRYSKDFSMSDFEQDPGYAFRLKEGMSALNNQAAARGGLISGNALRAAQKYGQEMGSQEYSNAFNRYQTNRANQLQPLGSLLASGQSAAANQGSAAGQYGVNAGNAYMAAGNAIGAGQLGSANSLAGGIQTGVSAYQNQTNFNDWLNRNKQQSAGPNWGGTSLSNFYTGTGTSGD
tara:strand:- start:1368 stop:2144 length:777 start_codon:yes stop_codon:yes gene_type:complete